MNGERPQFEAFWNSDKGKRREGTTKKPKERRAETETQAVALAQEVERAFAANDLIQALEKLRALERAVGAETVANREQYERFELEFARQADILVTKGYPQISGMDERRS